MPDRIILSQSAWILIDMLQQQLGVSIEVLDTAMRPLVAAAPESPSALDEPRIAAETLKSLRTGDLRIDRTTGVAIGIFPLRVARQVAGCLVVSPRRGPAGDVPPGVNVEGAGHVARTALESDLALTQQLGEVRARHRRAHGVLRFLAEIGASMDERAMMHAVVQAATLWFDLDCRIYHRLPGDTYALAASLPGIERPTAGARLERAQVERLLASRRFASGDEADDLGLSGRREEVLVLPVGDPARPEWLLLLAGAIDAEVELTFAALARVLGGELQSREDGRLARWGRLLVETRQGARRAPERTVLGLLEALAVDVGAHAASLTLTSNGDERALAAFGERRPAGAAEDDGVSRPAEEGTRYTTTIPIAPGAHVRLQLESRGDARALMLQADSWTRALQPWLQEVAARLSEQPPIFEAVAVPPFERRIQEEVERARRFNLGLGLVLIGPGRQADAPAFERLLPTVRSELRASDLVGRLRGGVVALLLVHAEPAGAESVIARLHHRLRELHDQVSITELRLGRAVFSEECSSAEALIARAQQEARRFELSN